MIKKILIRIEEFIFRLRYGDDEYYDYYSLKAELGAYNILFNKEYEEWYESIIKNKTGKSYEINL